MWYVRTQIKLCIYVLMEHGSCVRRGRLCGVAGNGRNLIFDRIVNWNSYIILDGLFALGGNL